MSFVTFKVLLELVRNQRRVGVGNFFEVRRSLVCDLTEINERSYRRAVKVLEDGGLVSRSSRTSRRWIMRPSLFYVDMGQPRLAKLEAMFEMSLRNRRRALLELREKDGEKLRVGESLLEHDLNDGGGDAAEPSWPGHPVVLQTGKRIPIAPVKARIRRG